MAILYKDILNKQLVYVDEISEKDLTLLNENFTITESYHEKILERYRNENFFQKLIDTVNYYLFDLYLYENKLNGRSFSLNFYRTNRSPFFELLIQKSLEYFEKAGLEVDFPHYDARITLFEYKEDTEGWPDKISLNDENRYTTDFLDLLGHVCIFCLEKDDEIEGGQLYFYPRYKEESIITNEFYYLLTGNFSTLHHELEIPIKKGSIIILSGDTYHKMNSMKILKNNKFRFIVTHFHYGKNIL